MSVLFGVSHFGSNHSGVGIHQDEPLWFITLFKTLVIQLYADHRHKKAETGRRSRPMQGTQTVKTISTQG